MTNAPNMHSKRAYWGHCDIFLDAGELVIFEFQLIAYIHAKGQQCDGDLGDNAGIIVPDVSVIAANVRDGAEHSDPLYRMKWVGVTGSSSGRPNFSLPRAMDFIRKVMFLARFRTVAMPSKSCAASPGARPWTLFQ